MRRLWPRRPASPPELTAGFAAEEFALAVTPTQGTGWLAATRLGLWVYADAVAVRWGWESISRVVLRDRTLAVTVAALDSVWPDGTAVLVDRAPREFGLPGPARLTDVVNVRVRRSVAASAYLSWPGAGGWVVLRRVPGRDGLLSQVRMDAGADADAPGFATAVAQRLAALSPSRMPE